MRNPKLAKVLMGFFTAIALVSLMLAVYFFPPVHERLAWRLANLRSKIFYFFNPPGKEVFSPSQQEQLESIVSLTLIAQASSSTPTPEFTQTPTLLITPTATETPTPTITPTNIPDSVNLIGVRHEYQKMNNCGPATLAMALSFWGWDGNQDTTRPWLRPHPDDRNIMPEELVVAVKTYTGLDALVRSGGDTEIIKKFIAAGFPVIVERDMGDVRPNADWTGHYGVITGYDDSLERFILQDSYVSENYPLTYADHYPPERESEVIAILGPHADEHFNHEYAANLAREAITELEGRDLFFAWFNLGTSLVKMGDYLGAAQAYDYAYDVVYPTIPSPARPWRMTWYQTGPYKAYYYTERYQDVVNLATFTIVNSGVQEIEETWLWRGRARLALGDVDGAIDDFHTALKFHPGWEAALAELNNLGVIP
jgi:hypothetical protein